MAGLLPAWCKEEPGTAQGVALGTHGDWDSASTWPPACPKWSQGPRRTEGSLTFGTWGCVSPALLRFPPLCSSKAPDSRVSATAEGSRALEEHYQEKKNRFKSGCGQQSPSLGVSLEWLNSEMLIQTPAWEAQGVQFVYCKFHSCQHFPPDDPEASREGHPHSL